MRSICITLGYALNIVLMGFATPDIAFRKKLLEQIEAEKDNFLVALSIAVQYDYHHSIALILEKKPEVIKYYDSMDKSPLYQATINGFDKSVECLLMNGAAKLLDLKDNEAMTVIHVAIEIGNKKIFKILMKYKLDLHDIDNGQNSMIKLLINKHKQNDDTIEIARMLLVRNAYYDADIVELAHKKNWPWLVSELQERINKNSALSIYVNSRAPTFFCSIQ